MRENSREYGATSGRPRRTGWFDAVVARHGVRINGVDSLVVTKIDILDALEEIKICTYYESDGRVVNVIPARAADLARCDPVYETMPGWKSSTKGVRKLNGLPYRARSYLNRISELVGKPISIISTGEAREDAILLESIWK